jgi:hypothetical protein
VIAAAEEGDAHVAATGGVGCGHRLQVAAATPRQRGSDRCKRAPASRRAGSCRASSPKLRARRLTPTWVPTSMRDRRRAHAAAMRALWETDVMRLRTPRTAPSMGEVCPLEASR